MFNHVRCQNNLVFPTHMTIKLYFRPYIYFIFLYVAAWLFVSKLNSCLSQTLIFFYFLISYSVILIKAKCLVSLSLSHIYCPTPVSSVSAISFIWFSSFHSHYYYSVLGPEVFLKVLKLFGIRIPLYWLKLLRTWKSFCLYSLHIYHI